MSAKRTGRVVAVLGGGVLAACGEVPADDATPAPIAVVQGTLHGTAPADLRGEVRVAIIWSHDGGRNRTLTTQDAAIEPQLPASYRLALDAPPPREALYTIESLRDAMLTKVCIEVLEERSRARGPFADEAIEACRVEWAPHLESECDGLGGWEADLCEGALGELRLDTSGLTEDFGLAEGTIVAYEDRNGNGRLDMLPHDARETVDRILGTSRDLRVLWTEGHAPRLGDLGTNPGFHLYDKACDPEEGQDCAPLLGLDVPVPLAFDADDRDDWLMCADGNVREWNDMPDDFENAPEGYPAGGVCSEDGLTYTVDEWCTPALASAPVCGPRHCSGLHYTIDDPGFVPEGWPCPVAE